MSTADGSDWYTIACRRNDTKTRSQYAQQNRNSIVSSRFTAMHSENTTCARVSVPEHCYVAISRTSEWTPGGKPYIGKVELQLGLSLHNERISAMIKNFQLCCLWFPSSLSLFRAIISLVLCHLSIRYVPCNQPAVYFMTDNAGEWGYEGEVSTK